MNELYTIVEARTVGEVGELIALLTKTIEADSRGRGAAECTAVHIGNKLVHVRLKQFQDGTREYEIGGV